MLEGTKLNLVTKVGKLIASYNYSPAVIPVLFKAAVNRRLPNTREANRAMWGWHDWSKGGDEWSNESFPDWKKSFIDNVMRPFIGDQDTVLEIGPGSGRWSEHLVARSGRTILVDVTPECIDLCRKRFGTGGKVEYYVNDGRSLADIPSGSIDKIWSFDVFVHILAIDIDAYIGEAARVLVPGGQALIHHVKKGTKDSVGWRSDLTAAEMSRIVDKHGLVMVRQFESWGDDYRRLWPGRAPEDNPDTVSVLLKPA
jgi:ubiquinone/menaquinone biosynthesis C-methylase UbiE